MAAMPYRFHPADLPRERLAALPCWERAFRRRRDAASVPRRPDLARAGLPLRASAAHGAATIAQGHPPPLLAHSLAKLRNLQHLSLARTNYQRLARPLKVTEARSRSMRQGATRTAR